MTKLFNFRWLAAAAGILGTVVSLSAQDSGALITALIRKGILTNQEAEDIRADLVREEMSGAYPLEVPLIVDVRTGENWDEMRPLALAHA